MRRFDQLERQLIGAGSFIELVDILLSKYKQAFGVEYVTLMLVDRDHEASRILENELSSDVTSKRLILLPSSATLETLYRKMRRPCLGSFNEQRHHALFKARQGAIASVALLPLIRQNQVIGSLHFGSSNPERYVSGCSTDLLQRLSEIIAICLENTLAQERVKLAGLTDALTGVQNRRCFEHRCQVEISQSRRYKHPLACMFLDLDKFKRINDTYGHQTGDEVLRSVANVIESQLRAGDTIARYGGEEFVVLLPKTEMHYAREIAERIRGSVAEKDLQAHSGHAIKVTISIGLSMLPADNAFEENHHQLAARLVAGADKALYQAKHGGRNQVACDESTIPVETKRHALTQRILRPFAASMSWLRQVAPEGMLGVQKYPTRS